MEIPDQYLIPIAIGIATVLISTIALLIGLFWKFHNVHLELERKISELKGDIAAINHELFLLSPIKEFIQKFGTEGAERVFKGGKK
jgi:hypothetical protein